MSGPTETPQKAARRLSASAIRDGFKPQALHTYTYPDGSVWYWRIRLKSPETGDKWIRPMRRNGTGYELGEPDFPDGKPLYRLNDLAARPHDGVMVVEGERKVDVLAKAGVLATTSGAADSAAKANWRPLAGRDATIWPDNDEAGQRYADAVGDALRALGCTVRVIDVEKLGLPPKGDAVDWLKVNPAATASDIAALPCGEARQRTRPGNGVAPAEDSAKSEWEEPQPLPDLPPVAAFDFALLPNTLRPWAEDISERLQCPAAYVGTAIMAAVGSVIGRKIGIRPQAQTDWTEYGNQWALLIGRPGVLKSPAMEQALGPIRRLSAQAIENHKSEMRRHAERLNAAIENNDKELPDKPILKRYIANDTTAAALGELHRQNPNGVLVHRDEIVSLLRSLDREENSEARGFYLTGWNANSPYTFDRIIRGLNLHIPAVCLSLLGSSQPGRIGTYLRAACTGGAGDDGLIQRFGLLVWPDTAGDWRDVDRWPNAEAKRVAFELFDHLDKASGFDLGGQQGQYEETPFLRFHDGGLELFQQWRRGLEARLRSEQLHPALESHLAKYRKLVPGLALILHLAERARGPVSETATLQALAWAEFLEGHAARAYASVTMADVSAARSILARVRKGDPAEDLCCA